MNLTTENTAIVLDSTADFPDAQIRFPNMRVVPLYVRFGDESFRDYVELDPHDFYERLRTAAELPTTSQPTPQDFLSTYHALSGYERIYSLHISSKLSGTFQSASLAAAEDGGDRIRLVDTESASVGIGDARARDPGAARARDDRRGDRGARRAPPRARRHPLHRRHARVPREGRSHRARAGADGQPAEREADPRDRGRRGRAGRQGARRARRRSRSSGSASRQRRPTARGSASRSPTPRPRKPSSSCRRSCSRAAHRRRSSS